MFPIFLLIFLVSAISLFKLCEAKLIDYLTRQSKKILNDVLNDNKINEQANETLKNHLDKLSTDEQTNDSMSKIIKIQLIKLLNDDEVDLEVVKLLQMYFDRIINSDQLRKSINCALELQVESLLKEMWFHLIFEEKVKDIVLRACDDDVIKNKITESFEEILDELLKSPKTKKTINDAISEMINDDEIQKLLGTAIRKGTKNAITGIFYA
jgi:hypothetical protein